MFAKFFGETEQEQIAYLQNRVIISVVVIVIALIVGIASGDIGVASQAFALTMLVVWGWKAMKSMFGITSIAAIFSGNLFLGFLIFLFYIIAAYLAGVFCAFVGILRYIYLIVKRNASRG